MHRCLYVDEIVRMIATNLNLPGNRRTLSRMALTCKTFHGPANEVLWEELPGLRPLLSLLPEDAYRIPKKRVCCNGSGEDEIPDVLMITRIPREEEWARVRFMARRVRVLIISAFEGLIKCRFAASYGSLDILRDYFPELVLFPNLRKIYIKDYNMEHYYSLFMSPHIRHVQLMDSSGLLTAALFSVLDTASQPSNVEELWVGPSSECGYGVENPSIAETLSRVVLRQTRLKKMDVPSHVSEEALIHLARMPTLECLRLDFYGPLHMGSLKTQDTMFPRLKRLDLNAAWINEDTAGLTSFFGAFAHGSSLEHLRLAFTTCPHDISLPDFFFAISEITSLKACFLEFSPQTQRWDGAPVSADVLKPLYRMNSISTLDLSQLPMDVSPDVIRKMAAAWPQAWSIELGQLRRQSTSSLTLEDIAPFAVGDHCHALLFGAIFLSETRPGWVAPLGSSQRLMEVDIGQSLLRVQDAPRLAAVFSRLFPAGKLVTSGWSPGQGITEAEQAVARINGSMPWRRGSPSPPVRY